MNDIITISYIFSIESGCIHMDRKRINSSVQLGSSDGRRIEVGWKRRSVMNILNLKDKWIKDEEMSFQGWDFSYLKDRWKDEELPWDYRKIIEGYLKPQHRLLDMGTGGGEFLLSLNHPYEYTSVTEAWEPNVKLCKEKLEPLGICVGQVYEDSQLPFEDHSFDIIINRHEAFDIKEINRILKPKGIFITQQVGGKNNVNLSRRLIPNFKAPYQDLDLEHTVTELKYNSFDVLYQNEYFPRLHFYDVGAVVYFAKIIQWEFPDFSVESCFDRLCDLEKELNKQGFIESIEHRFVFVAQKL